MMKPMRVSVPTLPQALLSRASTENLLPIPEVVERVADFLRPGNVAILTGAGVSVDSGIRAYRGSDGRYMNPNYKPIFYHELVEDSAKGFAFRQRYWLRSYLGYPPILQTRPNTTHYGIAALQYAGLVPRLVTQNVDGLHHRAIASAPSLDGRPSILELHGTLHSVKCSNGHTVDRFTFQDWLSKANPRWKEFTDDMERTGNKPRTNPDGDVAIEGLGISYDDFVVPDCPKCMKETGKNNPMHKPEVIFFGESIPQQVKELSYEAIDKSDRLLIMGTTLATYSAFRLLKHALDSSKPVLMINVGPSRADGVKGVEKMEVSSGTIIRDVVRSALRGSRWIHDPTIQKMLVSGVVKPPPPDDDDRVPRAVG